MKRLPFAWLVGGLIAGIIIVLLVGVWLAFAVVDRDLVNLSTPVVWPTGTAYRMEQPAPVFPSFTAFPSPMSTPVVSSTPPLVAVWNTLTPAPDDLPAGHPAYDPSQTCNDCHGQGIHGGLP